MIEIKRTKEKGFIIKINYDPASPNVTQVLRIVDVIYIFNR
jgi:hypothetical protein